MRCLGFRWIFILLALNKNHEVQMCMCGAECEVRDANVMDG
jgi:hypothetical protein